jgi:hypothetical protein
MGGMKGKKEGGEGREEEKSFVEQLRSGHGFALDGGAKFVSRKRGRAMQVAVETERFRWRGKSSESRPDKTLERLVSCCVGLQGRGGSSLLVYCLSSHHIVSIT